MTDERNIIACQLVSYCRWLYGSHCTHMHHISAAATAAAAADAADDDDDDDRDGSIT